MARTIRSFVVAVFLFSVTMLNAEPSSDADSVITLGQSVVPLSGPWKFIVGDSPKDPKTGKPLWADPYFDDSNWETVDLTPQAKTTDPASAYVPGWTARGHTGYWGWAWYRLRVKVAAKSGDQMAIDAPNSAEDAWQLFVGGQLVGSFGNFDSRGNVRRIYNPRPLMFLLPPVQSSEYGAITETLAFRVWMSPGSLANAGILGNSPQPGGLHYPPILVAGPAAAAQSRLDWQEWLIRRVDEAAYIALFLLLAVLSVGLMLFDRSDRVYLWIAATMLVSPMGYILVNVCATTTWLDARVTDILINTDDALQAAGWVMVWWVWFHFRRPAWVPRAIFVLMFCMAAADALKWGLSDFGIAQPHGQNAAILNVLAATSLTCRLLFVLALALVVAAGIRKEGKEGWFALPAVAALAVEVSADVFGIDVVGRFHGVDVQIWDLTDPFLVAVLAVLMVRRLLKSLKRQRQMALDVKQAQEVQQVLIPVAIPKVSGFSIEAVYKPAGQVGGDFFQILPTRNGAVLVAIGDVSGKGLSAAMAVSLLVGTLRTLAHYTQSPGEILRAMNIRMLARSAGRFTTCLVLRADADGSLTVANAGHLSPYLNGSELHLQNDLPLGLAADSLYEESVFHVAPNKQVTLMTDGVVEARKKSGELYGFERTMALANASAESIAHAALEFGQEDDITVLTLTRTGSNEVATSDLNIAAGLTEFS